MRPYDGMVLEPKTAEAKTIVEDVARLTMQKSYTVEAKMLCCLIQCFALFAFHAEV